jgi:hypothetical protein
MKNLKTFLVATTAIAMTSFGLSAQQDDKFFDGWYGGIEAAIDRTDLNNSVGTADTSFYYGLTLGYRYQTRDNWLFGLEGTFGRNEFDTNFDVRDPLAPSAAEIPFDIENDFQWSAAAVLGKSFDQNLLFAKVGFAGIQTSFEIDNFALPDGGSITSSGNFHDEGLLLGVGYERALTKRLSFTLGFDYITYGNGFDQYQPKAGIKLKF